MLAKSRWRQFRRDQLLACPELASWKCKTSSKTGKVATMWRCPEPDEERPDRANLPVLWRGLPCQQENCSPLHTIDNLDGSEFLVPAVPYIGREAGSLFTAGIETTVCQLPRAFPIGWSTKQRWKENMSSNTHTGRHTVHEGTIYFHTVAVESIRGTPADANKVRGAGISHRQNGDGNENEWLAKKREQTENEHDNMTQILADSGVHVTWSHINTNCQFHFLQNCCDNILRGQNTNEHYCKRPIVSALPSLLIMLKALPW